MAHQQHRADALHGQMPLADILVGRSKMDADRQHIIDERTAPWGVSVQSVEIRDIIIPQNLEDAMSRQAQAAPMPEDKNPSASSRE